MSKLQEQIKAMKEMPAAEYARQEAWDISQAANILQLVAMLVTDELDEADDVQSLANIMRGLMEYINGEITDMVSSVRTAKNASESKIEVINNFHGKVEISEPLNYSYIKSLNIGPVLPDLAVKFIARDEIKGYSILWGDENKVDLEVEYFTKGTNFWDEKPNWLTWDHAQDEEFKSDPRIGEILETGDDEWGKWYIARLKRSEAYRRYLDRMISEKRVGSSSDSAPQYVERVRTGKSVWLKTWPLFAVSLTDNPCEPRMIGSVDFLKSLVERLPEAPDTLGERIPDLTWQKQLMDIEYIKMKYGLY